MDGLFEILLPQESFERMDFKIPMFEWAGVSYPQGNEELVFGQNFLLRVQNDKNTLSRSLNKVPENYKSINWVIIEVLGDGLDIFMAHVHTGMNEEEGFGFENLLKFILESAEKWMVVFSHQYDGFNKVKKGDIKDILSSLSYEYIGGFLLYGEKKQ